MEESDKVFSMFKGKSVALIGPAQNLIGTSKGNYIDSFDIVCRVQNGFIIDKKWEIDYGKRCDVMFNTCNLTTLCSLKRNKDYIKKDCKLIICPIEKKIYPDKLDYNISKKNVFENYQDTGIDIPFFKVPDFREPVGLNTGMQSIKFLLTTEAKSIYIAGYDFHQVADGPNNKCNWHTYLCPIEKIICNIENCLCKQRKESPQNTKSSTIGKQAVKNFFKQNYLYNDRCIIDNEIKKLF